MKFCLCFVFLGLFALISSVNSNAQGIIAHWDFNSAVNQVIADKSGTHQAVISSNSTIKFFVSPDDKALQFNGGTTSVETKHTDDLSLEDDFTIRCIIKPTNFDNFRTILFKGDRKSVPNQVNYFLTTRYGIVTFMTKLPDNNWANWSTAAAVLNLNEWHSMVMSYKNGIVKLWINGKSCKVNQTTPPSGGKLIKNNFPVYIGHAQDISGIPAYPFVGYIDDIQIDKGALDQLNPAEITAWNNLTSALIQREKADRIATETAKIDLFGSRFSATTNDLESTKAKLALIAALPSTEFKTAIETFDADLNNLLLKSYVKKFGTGTDGFVLAPLKTSERIEKRPDFVTLLPTQNDSVKIQAAGNEYEGFQVLMVANQNKDVSGIQVKISDLVHSNGANKIKSDQVTLGRIQDIVTTPPDIPVDFVGAIPDMIEDDVVPPSIPKGTFVPVHFRVYVPSGTPGGNYNGTIIFTGNGLKDTIRLQLRVFDFSLPKRFALKMAFSFFENYYEDWYNQKPVPETQKQYIYNFLLKYGISPNNVYHVNGTYPELKYLEQLKDRINFFAFSFGGPETPVTDQELQTVVNQKAAIYSQIKLAGLDKYAYYYSYDEMSANMRFLPAANQVMPALRARIPELKAMQSSYPLPEFKNLFNVWNPLFYHYGDTTEIKVLNDRKSRLGDELWWYPADDPAKPYPNFFLDYPVFDCRIIGTLSYMYNIDGVLNWCINREWSTNMDIKSTWPQNPWKSYIISVITQQRVYKNGMGNLMYPGPAGKIYPSLRLENVRDGVEDFEYLTQLKSSIDSLKRKNLPDMQQLIIAAEKLLKVPSSVAIAVDYYSADSGNLLNYRKQIGEMIEKIGKVTLTGINARAETENPEITAYPNPFHDKTTIQYYLKSTGKVNVSIFNITGQLVEVLLNEVQPVGSHLVDYLPKPTGNSKNFSGLYICKISFNGLLKSIKLVTCP